jgi:hypothetical protein
MYRNDDRRNATYELFFSPPPAFLTFTNSRSEWVIYVALSKVLGVPKDPRQGPYIGWPGVWSYQSPFEGGRAARGGQVIDFIVHGSTTASGDIALRIQTERYHQFTDDSKHAKDEQLKLRVARMGRIVDLFEVDFMADKSGQAACIQVKQAIFGGSARNPLRSGSPKRVKAA